MTAPKSVSELSAVLRDGARGRKAIGAISLAALNGVIRHAPEDLTVRVESGITLGALQKHLAASGQWLPLDPPGATSIAIGEMLDLDRSGPRRFGFGTSRDWVIGLKAVLQDGRVIESGGSVVKNVAGYEIHKLLIGARGRLAVIAEATFKVNPLPESEAFFSTTCPDSSSVRELLAELLSGPVNPHVLDLHNLQCAAPVLVVGFCGSMQEIRWQQARLPETANWIPTDLQYAEMLPECSGDSEVRYLSVLPSELPDAIASIGDHPFVARAGNGVIYSPSIANVSREPTPLATRIQRLFDPTGRLASTPIQYV